MVANSNWVGHTARTLLSVMANSSGVRAVAMVIFRASMHGGALGSQFCLGRLERADVKDYCHKELLCDSSGEYLELYICVL